MVGLPHLRCTVDKRLAHRHLAAGSLHGDAQGHCSALQKRLIKFVKGDITGIQLGGVLQSDLNAKTVHNIVPPSNHSRPRVPADK